MTGRMLALAAAAFALLAAGCQARLDQGEVTAKKHEPARTYVTIVQMYTGQTCITSGTTRTCVSHYTPIPVNHYDDEDWILVLRDGDKKGVAYVTPDVWERATIGSWWDKNTDGGGSKDPTANIGG